MNLLQFVNTYNYNTDKIALGYIEGFYDRLFSHKKNEVKNLLEIGIYNGNSILLWKDFFDTAIITGVDINHSTSLIGKPRIIQTLADAYSESYISQLKDTHYDIIIDDGPHTFESMTIFLSQYVSKLKIGGTLVLEDIINIDWTDKLVSIVANNLNCKVEVVHMANKQRDPALNSLWQNGLDIIIVEKP